MSFGPRGSRAVAMMRRRLQSRAAGLWSGMDNDLPPAIGPHLQHLRRTRGLTLEKLAASSGVSRSMLSQIERGQANPTLATVWSLARALDLDVSELIGGAQGKTRHRIEVTAPSFVPEIRTEDGGCLLRILSPADRVGSLEWYDLTVQPGAALRSQPHARGSREHLTVIEGALVVDIGEERVAAAVGTTVRYPVDIPHAIVNEGEGIARALLVVTG